MITVRNKFNAYQEISETHTQKNMKTSSMITLKQQQNAYQLNQEPNIVPWETLAIRKTTR